MAINRIQGIEKYYPELLDAVLTKESLTEVLIGKNELPITWVDAKKLKIPSLATTGLTNYQRGGSGNANQVGAAEQSWEEFELTQERWSAIPLDTLDNSDAGAKTLGHLGKEFARVHIVQELDAYRFSKLASYTDVLFGNREELAQDITKANAVEYLNKVITWFDGHKVPANQRVIYISTNVLGALRNSSEIYKTLTQAEYKDVDFTIYDFNGAKVVPVPDDLFYTDLITDNSGYHPTATSKKIEILGVWAGATFTATRVNWSKVYNSLDGEAHLGYAGYELDNLINHDIFVLKNKVEGVYCVVGSTSAVGVGSGLLCGFKAGTSGKSIITRVLTQPAGIFYDKLVINTSSTLVVVGGSTSALTEVKVGVEFTPNASHNQIIASKDGVAVAVSVDFTDDIPTGA